MNYAAGKHYLGQKCLYFFLKFYSKGVLYHVTKGVKILFLQFPASFDFLELILDDAIVDIEKIVNFGVKSSFLDLKGKFVI